MAICPKVYHPNLCRIQVKDSKEPQFYNSAGNDSGPSCSSKATVLLYNCKSTSTISGSISKRKTNATFHGRISIKKSVMEEVISMAKLANIDVMKKENLLNAKDVDVGFAAKKIVTDLQRKKKVSESIRMNVRSFFSH